MRLLGAFLLVALTGSVTLAEDAKPADHPADAVPEAKKDSKPEPRHKVPLRVVKMLPETHQVLLFDKSRGTHVLAETGQDVGGYLVEEIDDDEVTLVTQNGAEVILTAPETRKRDRKKAGAEAATVTAAGTPTAPAAGAASGGPQDPYADPTTATTAAPIAAGDGGVRVASATPGTASAPPAGAAPTAAPAATASAATAPPAAGAAGPADPYGDPGIDAFAQAVGASPAPSAPAPAAPAAAAATGTPAPAVTGPPDAAAAPAFAISRHDVDAALADFGATAVTFDATFGADGLHFDHIAKGTILTKLGLQTGDVLTSVDNQPLRSLDDAANLYARAGTAKGAKLHVLRGGAPITVAVAIR